MSKPDREMRQMRAVASKFSTRKDGDNLHIEGYFSVFNSNYEIAPGLSESFAPGAFSNTLSRDIRALVNHNTTLVLGRNKAKTLELREDSRGLFGDITINPNDSDAMNLYARVERGDVDQCSIGFDIIKEDTDFREDGSIHWTIREVVLYEVSCCTFPAYEETSIACRTKQAEEIKKRNSEAWKLKTMNRLKGENNGTQNINA